MLKINLVYIMYSIIIFNRLFDWSNIKQYIWKKQKLSLKKEAGLILTTYLIP